MKLNINEISDRLKSRGISPSLQRMEIYRFVTESMNHPTADMIYNAISAKMPTLSKTTVYNTMRLFVEKKLVSEIMIDKNEVRYDANTDVHGHFLDEETGQITDFDVDISGLNPEFFKNVKVNEYHIYFKGVFNKTDSN